jgi:dimethylglycine dehydrogenase
MKSHARVVVIGGGVVGCSVLYHLAKMGWRDVVLCERKELTAGSSWHAAGGFHALNGDQGVARLQAYTIRLYRELQEESGQDIGLHFTGGLNIAATAERWEALRADWARHRVLGLETELIGPAQIREMCPIIDVTDVLGAVYDPMEGHLDPYGTTHAYAKAARARGAQIYRHTRVLTLDPTPSGGWRVQTDKGTIEAEHVVNAAGLWAREVGRMAGVELPLVPMEHHYLLTDTIAEIAALNREIPLILDLDGEIYLRQEGKGVLLGVYEKEATPWSLNGTPWDYGATELLHPNLDRLADSLSKGFARFPTVANAGIRRIVNGPFTFTPDGNPLVGPVNGLRHYWAACGVMAGFAQGGGVGLALAQWITAGEPEGDIFAMDVSRFGPYATADYTIAKARQFYSRRFQMVYPNEHWPAARPAQVSEIHDALLAKHAVFGASYGLEIPLYFAESQESAIERPSLGRSNAFEPVGEECRATRSSAGVIDLSSFGKYLISGPGAEGALMRLLAAKLPSLGRIRLTPMLAESGRLMGDLTTMRLAADQFWLIGSGYLQQWHMRWFQEQFAGEAGVAIDNISNSMAGIAITGPRARDMLAELTLDDISNEAFPFLSVRSLDIRLGKAVVARVSVAGELGFEIYVPTPLLSALYQSLQPAMAQFGARDTGMYALNSLRLEKGIGIWSREYSRDYTAREAGLARFIDYDRIAFIGREAALRERDSTPVRRLVTLEVAPGDADPSGYEPITLDDTLVGFVTSGGFGHCSELSLAMGYISCTVNDEESALEVTVLGGKRACKILPRPVIDPLGKRLRS